MATVIRMSRHGAKKHPYYHIIVINSREARDAGNVLEQVGTYDPMAAKDSPNRVKFDADKIKSWLSKGAKPSDRVYRFLANAGLLPKKEPTAQTKKNQPSEKTLAKAKAHEEKLQKAAAEAAAAVAPAEDPAPADIAAPEIETPAVEEKSVEEAPVETPAVEEKPAEEAPKAE